MPVPSKMADLYTIASSNSPSGSEAIGNSLDDYLRSAFSILRSTNALSSFTLASASTVDLGTADAEHVQITGTATIASFGTSVPGLTRECRFAGALTITASTNIITPGGTDLAVAAGDILTFRSMGSGVWRAVSSCGAALVRDGALSIAKTNGLQGALDGKQPSLGFTPVQQGTGVGQNSNVVKLGWNGTFLLCTVDTVDQGAFAMQSWVSANYAPNTSPVLSNGQSAGSAVAALKIGTTGFGSPVGFYPRTLVGNYNDLVQAGDAAIIYSLTGSNTLGFTIAPFGGGGGLRLDANGNAAFGGAVTIGAGRKISKVTLSSAAPGTLADGELYLQY